MPRSAGMRESGQVIDARCSAGVLLCSGVRSFLPLPSPAAWSTSLPATRVLARHYDIEGLWYWGNLAGSKMVEEHAAASMKRTWVNYGKFHDWENPEQGQGEVFLRKATEIKNIWIPYGE